MNPELTLEDALAADAKARRAAVLEEDDASAKPNGNANGHDATPCLFCTTNRRRTENSDYCQTCWDEEKRTGVKKKPIIGQPQSAATKPAPKPSQQDDDDLRQCAKCKKHVIAPNRSTSICDNCAGGTPPGICDFCKRSRERNGLPGRPTRPHSDYCEDCYKKILPKFRLKDIVKHKPQCSVCGESPALDPENGGDRCFHCTHHGPTTPKKQTTLEFPEECMYGWLGDYARKLDCPLSAAYPAVLAVAAGYGVPFDKRVRTTLYVTILGRTRAGKSVTKDRAVDSWAPPSETQIATAYPGSEIGLVQILGGKKAKDMTAEDHIVRQPYLLVQDEMRLTFGKIAIQNSALPNALNEMFYKDSFETAAKQGRWACSAKLSILGCLTCANPDEFADIYGVDTATGLYGRTIFGIVPSGWDFRFATWEPPVEPNGDKIRRCPKSCKVTAEAFRMADEWAKENIAERGDLKELALRVALITASLNHEDEVSEECMRRALVFMEWQQRIRDKYRPSEMDTPSGKCQQAIVRALEHYEDWVPWRDLCRNHSLYKNKAWDATVLNRVKRAMVFEGMLDEEVGEENSEGKREKTGRVRLIK